MLHERYVLVSTINNKICQYRVKINNLRVQLTLNNFIIVILISIS